MRKEILSLFIALASGLLVPSVQAQTRKYLVLLKDKANSPYSITRPEEFLSTRSISRRKEQGIRLLERDLPVNPRYITQLQQTGATIWFRSRWLNAVLVEATESTLASLRNLPFVLGIEGNRALSPARQGSLQLTSNQRSKLEMTEVIPSYGSARSQLLQIGIDKMHAHGFHGEGILVAILDAGFRNADRVPYLSHLFAENRIIGTYDFVQKEPSVYEDDSHGLNVLSIMGSYQENALVGPAYKSSYLLLRTEDVFTESPIEEANWLFGAEYADSAGVDVINSSLGYTEFDDPAQSHTYSQLNGQTTLVTRAAQWASEAGIIVVNSAGNEGSDHWKYIGAPADAPGILSIGAIDTKGIRAPFSSIGPTPDGRVKPDLVAQGVGTVLGSPGGMIATGNGTSFSCPLVAALAAGLRQAFPRLTARQIIEVLRQSGSQFSSPDTELGYGIPNFERAAALASDSYSLLIYPNPFTNADQLTVQWNEIPLNQTTNAMLINSTGQLIWQQSYLSNQTVSLSLQANSLAPGTYFLTLFSEKSKRTMKLIKY